MIVWLLTEHYLEFLSLKGGCRGSSVYTCQNATLLEITYHIVGNLMRWLIFNVLSNSSNVLIEK